MTDRVYLDWNATAPLHGEARAAMIAAMDAVGNPSSVHAEGRAAKGDNRARRAPRWPPRHSGRMGPQEVVFTSGATEAAALGAEPGAACTRCDVFEHDTAHDAALGARRICRTWMNAPMARVTRWPIRA